MAKSKNNFGGLVSHLSAGKSSSANPAGLLSATGKSHGSLGAGNLKAGSNRDTRTAPLSSSLRTKGIEFGTLSSSKGIASQPGTDWTHLLTQTMSGGLASALGGSFGLGSIGGLGSIISGIASLFGSAKKSPAPLAQFQLPHSQNATVYIANQTNSGQWIQDQSAQIAQAVKTALLHSSSLGDVIADI